MIVLDTNVVSELMRPSPEPAVMRWLGAQTTERRTTAMTLAEIRFGIARLPAGRRRQRLGQAAEKVFEAFGEQVLPFDRDAARAYAELAVRRERLGRPISQIDAQIAAVCRTCEATLATRNVTDFRDTGFDLVNPWA